jgi:hypothetical protein
MPFHQESAPRADPSHLPKRHQEYTITAKSDDLGEHGPFSVLARNLAELSHRSHGTITLDHNSDRLSHTAGDGKRIRPFN